MEWWGLALRGENGWGEGDRLGKNKTYVKLSTKKKSVEHLLRNHEITGTILSQGTCPGNGLDLQ